MRATRRAKLTGVVGVFLLGVPALRLAWNHPAAVSRIERQPPSRPRRDAAEQTLWLARRRRARAVIAVNRDRDALEAWDPAGLAGINEEAWRVQWMAADPTGDCGRAMALAEQAAILARNPDEAYDAAELLVLLDHERGDHRAALEQARRLVALRPHSDRARMVFRIARKRAARDQVYRSGRLSGLSGRSGAVVPPSLRDRGGLPAAFPGMNAGARFIRSRQTKGARVSRTDHL